VLQTNQCHMARCCKEAMLLRRYRTNEELCMSSFHIQDFIIYKGRRWGIE